MMGFGARRRQQGFNLIEVMAAVVVVAFGLLALAKVQAMAVSDSTTSSGRSLAALQVQSLAAAMHGNSDYWLSAAGAGTACSISGSAISGCSGISSPGSTCTSSSCTSTQIAAVDLSNWAQSMSSLLPGFTGSLNCSQVAPAVSGLNVGTVSCTVVVNWNEKQVSLYKSAGGAAYTNTYTTTIWP